MKQCCIEKKCPNKRYAVPTKVTPERMRRILCKGEEDASAIFDVNDTDTAAYAVAVVSRTRSASASGIRHRRSSKAVFATEEASSSKETSTPYNQEEYCSLWKYYLDPVKRKKEELPGGIVLRAKSVSCNLLRYNNCDFRRELYKEIHRLKRRQQHGEIHQMLKMLYEHDVSGNSGDGPSELVKQILPGTTGGADEPQAMARINKPEVVVLDDSNVSEDEHAPQSTDQTVAAGGNVSVPQKEIKTEN